MALSSTSTTQAIKDAYDDNADYDIGASVSRAKDFIHACRLLLRRMAQEIAHGDERVEDEYLKIKSQLDEALAWWRANDPAATNARPPAAVRHSDFAGFRS